MRCSTWRACRWMRTSSSLRSWRPRCRSLGAGRAQGMASAVRTYLEMTDPSQLTGTPAAPPGVTLAREEPCSPALWRWLYAEVGRDYHWVDRLEWTDDEISRYLTGSDVELWVLREGREIAGYFELKRDAEGGVELAYFGLLPAFTDRGLGKYLLA